MHEHIECPRCGKKTVVKSQDNYYQCLACDFQRDLSEYNHHHRIRSGNRVLWAGVFVALASFFILQARYITSNTPTVETNTAPIPAVNPNLETETAPVPVAQPNLETETAPVPATQPNLETETAPVPATQPNLETEAFPASTAAQPQTN